jgi:hypothetical protein
VGPDYPRWSLLTHARTIKLTANRITMALFFETVSILLVAMAADFLDIDNRAPYVITGISMLQCTYFAAFVCILRYIQVFEKCENGCWCPFMTYNASSAETASFDSFHVVVPTSHPDVTFAIRNESHLRNPEPTAALTLSSFPSWFSNTGLRVAAAPEILDDDGDPRSPQFATTMLSRHEAQIDDDLENDEWL